MELFQRISAMRGIARWVGRASLLTLFLLGPAAMASATAAEDARIRHLLQRATFGLAPGEIQEVRRMGRNGWIGRQLMPDGIADPALDEKLAVYPALSRNSAELLRDYPQQNRDNPQGIGPPGRILGELQAAQLTRAVHAKAQLREVLTDF